jgi:hypothetical protein
MKKIDRLQKEQAAKLKSMLSEALIAEQQRADEYRQRRSAHEWTALERRFAAEREDERNMIELQRENHSIEIAHLRRKSPAKYRCRRCGEDMWITRQKIHDLQYCSDRLLPCVHFGCKERVRLSERVAHEAKCKVAKRTHALIEKVKVAGIVSSVGNLKRPPVKCHECGDQFPANQKSLLRGHLETECKRRWIDCPHANCSARIRACDLHSHERADCASTWCRLRRKLTEKERAKQRTNDQSVFESAAAKMGMGVAEAAQMLKMRRALQLLITEEN